MAKKRLTDLEKWKKPFFKKLPAEYKLFWLYLLDDCDHCGIWHLDQEVAEIRLGVTLSLQKAQGLFGERVVEFDNGTKWFLPDFIGFQYGQLDDKNKMSKAVIPILKKYDLMGHLSPINGVKVTVTDKVKDIIPIGAEKVKEIAKKVWNNQIWKDQVCMANSLFPEDLKKWMAMFNASVMNDTIEDFSDSKYQKIFNGWLHTQKAKGVKLQNKENQSTPLQKL